MSRAIREMLDDNGYVDRSDHVLCGKICIRVSMVRSVMRQARAPSFGDRKSYQMDYHNSREGIKEALLDVEEGADIIMVKPAMSYLDIDDEGARRSSMFRWQPTASAVSMRW